jgi:Metallo-beta-lactamase superfamily.
MKTAADLLFSLAFAGCITGFVGIFRGRVKFLKLRTRKACALFMTAMLLISGFTMSLMPDYPVTGSDSAATEEKAQTKKTTVDEKLAGMKGAAGEKYAGENRNEKTSSLLAADPDAPSGEFQTAGRLSVHFIDVGQGAAQLIITPSGKVMLIDAGNNDDEKDIVAYLKQLGIRKVDILIGTHPDADHIGGLDAVIDAFAIGNIYMPKVARSTETFESVLTSIERKGLKVNTAKAGITLDLDPSITVNMLAPIGTHSEANEMSAVVRLVYGTHSFLFTGDAGYETEEKLIQSGVPLQSTVLLVAHHGSNHSTGAAFLNRVKPVYSVIQVGKNNYGHPDPEVLKRLKDAGTILYRNDTDGTIVFTTDGKTLEIDKKPTATPSASGGSSSTGGLSSNSSSGGTAVVPFPSGSGTAAAPSRPIRTGATIDNPNPKQNSQVSVTVSVKDAENRPVAGAKVTLTLHYQSKDTVYDGNTDSNGICVLSFRIGRAAKGVTVRGDIAVNGGGKAATAAVSFTPQ